MPKFKDNVIKSAGEGKPFLGIEEVVNFLQDNNKYVKEESRTKSIEIMISGFLNILRRASKSSSPEVAKFLSKNVLELYSKESTLKFLEGDRYDEIRRIALKCYIKSLENILSKALHNGGEEIISIIELLEINYRLHKTIRDRKLFEVEGRMRELIEELNLSSLTLEVLLKIKDKVNKKVMGSVIINREELDKAIVDRGEEHIKSLGCENIDELRGIKESPLIPHELKKKVEKRIAEVIDEGLKKIGEEFEKAGIKYIEKLER